MANLMYFFTNTDKMSHSVYCNNTDRYTNFYSLVPDCARHMLNVPPLMVAPAKSPEARFCEETLRYLHGTDDVSVHVVSLTGKFLIVRLGAFISRDPVSRDVLLDVGTKAFDFWFCKI